MHIRSLLLCALGAATLVALPTAAAAQTQEPDPGEPAATRDAAPRLYLDCNRCDMSHVRREITFVNYVREADQAQVHVLVTDEPTGAGGRRYTLAFLGRGQFDGADQTLTYTSGQRETPAEVRDGLTAMLKVGLVPYVARTPLASGLEVTFREEEDAAARTVDDPWNSWTFEVYGGGNFNTETNQGAWNARYGFYANRVTEEWKLRLRPYFNNNVRVIRREDAEDIRVDHRRHGFDSYAIKSVGEHWGAGVFGEYITTTIDNIAHSVTVAPAVEYSLFPYREASRRSITLTYRVGYELADYIEETIFEQTEETLLNHALVASVQFRQPWGSISSSLRGSHYFHDASHHRLTANGNVSFRLGGGVSLNIGGSYQRINDQLSLPRGDASLEDILLERRRLSTAYRGTGSIGLSYTFGSIFTNVVNPRL